MVTFAGDEVITQEGEECGTVVMAHEQEEECCIVATFAVDEAMTQECGTVATGACNEVMAQQKEECDTEIIDQEEEGGSAVIAQEEEKRTTHHSATGS